MQEFNAIYADGHFERVVLGKLVNKGGAEGKIYENANNPDYVIKLFHTVEKSQTYRQKLEAMILNPPNIPMVEQNNTKYVQIAWPVAVLENDKGFCVGYMMPLVKTQKAVSLDHFMQKAIRNKLGLSEKYAYRIFAAYNVASMVAAIHKKGHYIVDLKPSNVYVYKDNMLVAMLDCDGFSIAGKNMRYPAEFVSEEYIYPEGMDQDCQDMGQEQDDFALAVIIFKLLNNGIHPFSGTPRKNNAENLSIQARIEKYHYAYGLWPDSYQAPHPYSIHDYFDKKTMEMFDRAFTKGKKRPSAQEWQKQLHVILKSLKTCKNNPNHNFWTSKGCGQCISDQKLKDTLLKVQQKHQQPKTIRGMKLESLSSEGAKQAKIEKSEKRLKQKKLFLLGISAYMLCFAIMPFVFAFINTNNLHMGIGLQMIIYVCILWGAKTIYLKAMKKIPMLDDDIVRSLLIAYSIVCLLLTMYYANGLSFSAFYLAKV